MFNFILKVNFEKVNVTSGDIIKSISAKSNFDCILQCIKIFQCKQLVYRHDLINNCYLKNHSGNQSSLIWEHEENFRISGNAEVCCFFRVK